MINGKSIELISVVADVAYMEPTIKAIRKSLSLWNKFDDVKIICPPKAYTDHEFTHFFGNFTFENYSEFMVKELHECVNSDFCICMQWDSCIIDASKWTDVFLECDYIGAPWQNNWANRVGCGGFSWRSQKLLKESAKLDYIKTDNFILNNEDVVICAINYGRMLSAGVKFAPLSLARQFCVERPIAEAPHNYDDITIYNSFAFHGSFNNGGIAFINDTRDS